MLPHVKLSKRAEKKFESLFNYLETKWSSRVKNNFVNKLEKAISQIQQHPEGSPKSEIIKGLHKHVITKQTTIYYKYDQENILPYCFSTSFIESCTLFLSISTPITFTITC